MCMHNIWPVHIHQSISSLVQMLPYISMVMLAPINACNVMTVLKRAMAAWKKAKQLLQR